MAASGMAMAASCGPFVVDAATMLGLIGPRFGKGADCRTVNMDAIIIHVSLC
jgi:hypothetical protein